MRSSQMLDNIEPPTEPGVAASVHSEKTEDARVSAFLRTDADSQHSQKQSADSSNSRGTTPINDQAPRPSFMTSNFGDSSSPGDHSTPLADGDVKREDLRASAEKILYTYLLSGSEREIIIPRDTLNRITEAIEEHGRDDPQLFDEAKDYVFQAMERDAFPGFLQSKAFGNLVPASMLARVIITLIAAFGAFWTAWACILLNYSRSTRAWVSLVFAVRLLCALLTPRQGRPSIDDQLLLSRDVSLPPRPDPRLPWHERADIHVLCPRQRALRPDDPPQARTRVRPRHIAAGRDHPHRIHRATPRPPSLDSPACTSHESPFGMSDLFLARRWWFETIYWDAVEVIQASLHGSTWVSWAETIHATRAGAVSLHMQRRLLLGDIIVS